MSVVTALIVHTGWGESATTIRAFVDWFEHQGIVRLGHDRDRWGGTHLAEGCDLWAGSYDHFARAAFLDHMASLDWVMPKLLQIFIHREQDRRFALYQFDQRQIVEVVAPPPSEYEEPMDAAPDGEAWFEDPELLARFGKP